MKRLLTSAAIVGAALALGACGSSGGSSNNETSGSTPANSSDTVSVEHVANVGDVLVDRNGMALYTPEQEASGMILCTGACESFWKPLQPGSGTPTAAAGVADLAVITRPDGTKQVTDDGKPLYTFTEDSKGKVTGNDFSDDFNGQQFTWHAEISEHSSRTSGTSGTCSIVTTSIPSY